MTSLTIGKLASAADVAIDTLRYYERKGLVVPDGRSASGYREYGPGAVGRVKFIRKAQGVGFTLAEIQRLLEFDGSHEATTADVLELTEAKIAEHHAKIRLLRRLRAALTRVAQLCPGDDTPATDCPILHYMHLDANENG